MGVLIICIGFPKCGTKYLLDIFQDYTNYKILKRKNGHPEICHDFYELTTEEIDPDRDYICKTPGWIFKTKSLIAIKNKIISFQEAKIISDYKIVINIRNPFEYLKSFYNMRITEKGLEDSFQDFLQQTLPNNTINYLESANHYQFIMNAYKVFNRNYIYLINNEVLCHNKLEELFTFLGVNNYKSLPSLDYVKKSKVDYTLFTGYQIQKLLSQYNILEHFLKRTNNYLSTDQSC